MITKISAQDLNDIVTLRVEIFKAYCKINSQAETEAMLTHNLTYFRKLFSENKFYGYLERGAEGIISIALGLIQELPPICFDNLGKRGYIFNVFTVEKFRNQGRATKLVELLINALYQCGATRIELEANEKSVPLYKKLGFKRHPTVLTMYNRFSKPGNQP